MPESDTQEKEKEKSGALTDLENDIMSEIEGQDEKDEPSDQDEG